MGILQRVHLGRAAGLATAFHHVGDLVVDLQERHGAARLAAAAHLLAGGADGGEIGAGPRAELEEHRLRAGEVHDRFHVVLDGLDEAGAALGVLVLGRRALGLAGLAVEEVVALAAVLADAVLVVEANIEPDGRIEGTELVDAEPGQFLVEGLGVLLRLEVAVGDAPIGDGAGDAVDELADGGLAAVLVGIGAVGDVAVEVLRNGDLGGEHAPALGHLDVFLLEDGLAGIVGDLRGPLFPVDFVEGMDVGLREDGLEREALGLRFRSSTGGNRRGMDTSGGGTGARGGGGFRAGNIGTTGGRKRRFHRAEGSGEEGWSAITIR